MTVGGGWVLHIVHTFPLPDARLWVLDTHIFAAYSEDCTLILDPVMYNRKQLCLLSGMELESFKHAAKHDMLPLRTDINSEFHSERIRETYSKYSVTDVLAVACAVQLMNGGGYVDRPMPFAVAAKIVGNNLVMLHDAVRRSQEQDQVVYVGYAAMNSLSQTAGRNIAGTWSEIGAILDSSSDGNEVTNVYLVVPAHVERIVAERAQANDVEWQFLAKVHLNG